MKVITVSILAVVLVLLLTSCDDRGGDKPTISMSANRTHLYSDNNNLNHATVAFVLDGSPAYAYDAKILVEYNSAKGIFVGTGSSEFVRTDNQGIASGTFQVYEGVSGIVTLKARLDRFRNVEEILNFVVYKLPQIDQFYATSTTIDSDGSTDIFVKLVCPDNQADNIKNQTILFTSNQGLLQFASVTTNNDGIAQNHFSGNGATGTAVITARLQINQSTSEALTITLQ